MDRLQAMTTFTRVVETHSFRKAAGTMSLPASTVTKVIKELEAYLGTRLLNRTTRQISLTSDGRTYYDRCKAILSDVEFAESALAGKAGRISGRLRVDTTPSLARTILIPGLPAFFRNFPDIELILTSSDRTVDLVQEGVDCVIRAGFLQSSATLVARRVAMFERIMCASPEYIRDHGEPAWVEDLKRHHAVGYLSSRTGRTVEWEFREASRYPPIKMVEHLIVNDTDSYVDAGLRGLGLIRPSSYMVSPYLADGRLLRILGDVRTPIELLSIMYPQSGHRSPAFSAFVDWCAALFAKHETAWTL